LLIEMLRAYERRETAAMAPLAALAQDAASQGTRSPEAFLELLRTMVTRASTHPELGRLFLVLRSEALDPSHPAHAAFRARQAEVLDLFTKLAAPYAANPRRAGRQLAALMDGLAYQWAQDDQHFDIVEEWDEAVRTLLPHLVGAR
jgi:hypothetical protein